MERLSIVVTNHNYEQFVGEAIDSALAVRWPDVEVVVVDDGSTDGSREVIAGYAGRVSALLTENATQRVAANRGFAETTGDVVVFLDADDAVPVDLAERLAPVWSPSVAKAQFTMQRVDADGRPTGEPFPRWDPVPSPHDIRRWAVKTTAYPTPPGSGNAYARWFLERVLPAGPEIGDAADSGPLAAAPFHGDVVTVPEVVVRYRRHGRNDSALLVDAAVRFPREVERARQRWRFAQQHLPVGAAPLEDGAVFRSRELLQLRVATRRLAPGRTPLPGDGTGRMLRDAVLAPLRPGPEPWGRRLAISFWCLATLLGPHSSALRLIRARYGR